jgi:histidyl-tRNA synthetase
MSAAVPLPPQKPRGFQDRLDHEVDAEDALVRAAAGVYERFGFRRLETPALEYTDALGKFLPDQDRANAGVFSLRDDDERWLSLRYDLTAPLARYVAEHWQDLPKPFRRWQAGPVWRNEKPGPGRFRQFMQCDADSVGVPGPAADAEIIVMAGQALQALGVAKSEYSVRVNTRRLLNGVLDSVSEKAAIDMAKSKLTVLRAIDKLDRLGVGGVTALLGAGRKDESGDFTPGAGLSPGAIDVVVGFINAGGATRAETLRNLEKSLGAASEGKAGIEELSAIARILDALEIPDAETAFDPTIVRGLEYYTGPVFEAQLTALSGADGKAVNVGSIGGGGRYDDLVARFRGESVPATGFSIGVSRLLTAMEAAGRPLGATKAGPVLILAFSKEAMGQYFALAAQLRAGGIDAEVYLGEGGMKAQMRYADRRVCPVAVFYGDDEIAKGIVTLKDLRAGAAAARQVTDNAAWREQRPGQFEAPYPHFVAAVRDILARGQ